MHYVESLRATRALFIGGIILAAVLGINLVIFLSGGVTMPDRGWVDQVPSIVIWGAGAVCASIFASFLGLSLARENDGHLPVAWTKPASKAAHAAVKIGVDVAAITLFFAASIGVVFAYLSITGLMKYIAFTPDMPLQLVRFFIAPLAVYGLVQCLTASLDRRAGTVLGMTWFALFVLSSLGKSDLPEPFHSVFAFINYANPLVYIAIDISDNGSVITASLGGATLALAAIAIVGTTAAIVQWQRLEAS